MWLLVFLFIFNGVDATEDPRPKSDWSHYNQNDWDMEIERVELMSYNKSYLRFFKIGIVFPHRTQKAINGSGYVLQDWDREYTIQMQYLRFVSNEYRFFPLTLNLNLCHHYELNSFHARDYVYNFTSLTSCTPGKGYFYIRNFIMDPKYGPPFMVRGRYKVEIAVYHISDLVVEVHLYNKFMDKPLKWE